MQRRREPHHDSAVTSVTEARRRVPVSALAVSVVSLALPLLATVANPGWHDTPEALLFVLPALIPPFLLSYFKGWGGAARALAAGMATLVLVQLEIRILDLPGPSFAWVLSIVVILVVVSIGTGVVAELLLRERERALARALVDPLTGLPNRRHVLETLEREWARARRGSPLSVVIFDLDHFKEINDLHGHAVGDDVLRAFADVLAERTRLMDVSGRIGGEEFLSVLPDCELEGAVLFARAVRARLAEVRGPAPVTASIGIAALQPGMNSPDVLVAAADQALYRAKREGRDTIRTAAQSAPTRPELTGRSRGPVQPEAARAQAAAWRDLRIVLVDDDAPSLRSLVRVLESGGGRVHGFTSGEEALDFLRTDPEVDVLVTDVMMPEMSGFALADLVAEFRSDLPVLYVSGYPQSEAYWGGTPGTVRAFLEKPLDPARLRYALERLLDEVRAPGRTHPRIAEAEPALDAPDRPEEARILLIDDAPAVLRGLRHVLGRAGFVHLDTTSDAGEALTWIRERAYDLVVTDLRMPGVDGFEVIERSMEGRPEWDFLPVLVLTADRDPATRRRALALGASDFLNKPFDEAEVRARVRNLLRLRFFVRRLSGDRDRLEWLVQERTTEVVDAEIEMAHRLAVAAEYRDDVTGRHAARVGLLASRIARELGLPPRDVDRLRRAAPLHDVGKIGIPDAVLNKPGPLTEQEFEAIRAHPRIGAEILGNAQSPLLRMACEIALRHHERWDGTGYPDGLSGEEIPLSARITAVADTFDVISHRRPYKPARSIDDAFAEIIRCAGSHFDPAVVDAFVRVRRSLGSGEPGTPARPDPAEEDPTV